jgi:hypothetical protein
MSRQPEPEPSREGAREALAGSVADVVKEDSHSTWKQIIRRAANPTPRWVEKRAERPASGDPATKR